MSTIKKDQQLSQTTVSGSAYRKAQVIKCKCGSIFAACLEPHCYTDSDWQRDLRKYVKQGNLVEILDCSSFNFEKCKCKEVKEENSSQASLF